MPNRTFRDWQSDYYRKAPVAHVSPPHRAFPTHSLAEATSFSVVRQPSHLLGLIAHSAMSNRSGNPPEISETPDVERRHIPTSGGSDVDVGDWLCNILVDALSHGMPLVASGFAFLCVQEMGANPWNVTSNQIG